MTDTRRKRPIAFRAQCRAEAVTLRNRAAISITFLAAALATFLAAWITAH